MEIMGSFLLMAFSGGLVLVARHVWTHPVCPACGHNQMVRRRKLRGGEGPVREIFYCSRHMIVARRFAGEYRRRRFDDYPPYIKIAKEVIE